MAPSEETSDRRGGGGKFRREPNRSTPYERPPLDSGRIRKNVIDPALRITKTASHKLFSLLFPNNLPRISSNSEVNCELRDAFPAVPSNSPGAQEQVTIENGSLNNNSHSSGINDFEQMITQKTFTRDELEHLIELLQSKTSDVPAVDEHRRIERSTSELVEAPSGKGKFSSKENEIKSQTVHAIGSAHLGSSSILESDVASPAELAKAYMGRSSSKLTPLPINLHSHTFREDCSWKTNLPFTPKSNSMLLGPGTGVPYGSVARRSENGYATPVSRGRSDTYSVARTPYSRAHHTSMLKAVDPMTDGRAGPSTSSQRSWVFGGKQTSKRRSSVLDCDIGSIGAIRRTRRKTNMMLPTGNTGLLISKSPLPIPLTPIGSDAVKGDLRPISSHQKKLLLDETKRSTSVGCHLENGENRIAGKRSVGVPTQSVETAQKIFRELEKCFSSPKGKSPELMTTTVIEGSPPKLTPGDSFVTGVWDLISQKQAVVDVDGPSKIFISEGQLGPQSHGVVTDLSAKDTVSPTKAINVIQEKPVFGGTENWGAVAFGSNSIRSRDKSSTLDTVRRKDDASVVERKGIADGGESMVPSFNGNTTASFQLGKSSDSGALDEKDIRLAGPVTSVTGIVTKEDASTSLSSSPSSLSRPSTYGEPTGVQCSLAVKSVDEATLVTFSSASVGNQCSDLDGAQSEGKLETVSRCCSTSTTTSKESLRSSSSDNVDNGDLFRQVKHTIPSSAPSTSTQEFSYRTMNVSTTSSVVVPDPFPERSRSNTMFPDPSSSTTSALTVTKVDSSIFSGSLHQSGLCTAISAAPMNSASVKPKSTNSESKMKSTSSFSTLESSFGIKTLPFTGSSSSSSFVFGASATSSAAFPAVDNKLQIFNTSGADSGSLPGTVSSAFTQSLQKQLDTSALSQVFGLSRPFSASSGGVLSVSSPPSAKLSEADSTSLGSAMSFASLPALFSSSSQPSTSSIFGTSFSSTGFNFGSSSPATASLASSLMASGSSLSTSSGSILTFTSPANVNSGPLSSSFPVSTGANPFSSFSSVSPEDDQMSIEDCTPKPTVPASNPMIPDFGQPSSSSQSNFVFSASSSSGGAPIFQFNSQQNPGSFESSGGGLFSVGTGGGVDKSNRRYIKAKRDKLRKR